MERIILHADLNACYASVECMLHPELRDQYVAVCGSTEERHGIVLAKNERAKKMGVRTGQPVWQARQVCPRLVTVPPHMEQYLYYSQRVHEIYLRYARDVEPFGIDESWIDLTGSPLLGRRSACEIAHEIRRTVKGELGLTVSVGVSFNKIFAKLGSDMKKPDAVTEISRENFREKVWPLPASELLYVGPATTKKLARYGIRTIGQIAGADPAFLRRILGVNGLMLWRFAAGKDDSRVMPCDYHAPVKSVGHGITCTTDLRENQEVMHVLMALSQDVAQRLRKHRLTAGGVQISVRDDLLATRQYQCQLRALTQNARELWQAGYDLFLRQHVFDRGVRALTIRAIRLAPEGTPEQTDLLGDFARRERTDRLERAVEDIRRRFGKTAIETASLLGDIHLPMGRTEEVKLPGVMYCGG